MHVTLLQIDFDQLECEATLSFMAMATSESFVPLIHAAYSGSYMILILLQMVVQHCKDGQSFHQEVLL